MERVSVTWKKVWDAVFLDVVLGDALYLQQKLVNAVESLTLEGVISRIENQPDPQVAHICLANPQAVE